MKDTVAHRLVGYDRETELLATELEIPSRSFDAARRIAMIDPGDAEALGSYPLTRQQALETAELIGRRIEVGRHDFFVEPFEAGSEEGAARVDRARAV